MIAETAIDLESNCADAQRRGLQRISETMDQVPFEVICNLANLSTVMRGALMGIIKVHLMAVGGGPSLDHADAAAFLAPFVDIVEKVRTRKIN
jgi:hypothetical protein